jgi:predicted dehydrogenase
MLNKKLQIGIIGAGYMSNQYLKVIKASKNIECSAIFSRTKNKPTILKRKYKIKKVFDNINDFILKNKFDGLIVAVNEQSAFKVLRKVYKLKCPILFEKPLGVNYNQANLIKRLIKNKKNIYIALNRRFYSSTLQAKEIITKKKNKRLIKIDDQETQKFSKLVNNNLMYSNSIHLIDYITIFARGKLVKVQKIKSYKKNKFHEVIVKLFFSSQDEVLYYCNWNSPGSWSVSITQKDQRCEMKPLEQLTYEKFGKNKKIFRYKIKSNIKDIKFKSGLYYMLEEFKKLIKQKKHEIPNFLDYFNTIKLIKIIYE